MKLKGKNPTNEPDSAVISIIAIKGELLSVNIISSEKHDIKHIPDERPSNPSIKLIALVIPTIHITVIKIERELLLIIVFKLDKTILSILIPLKVTTNAANICPISFTYGGIPFQSSKKQNNPSIIIPKKNPNNLI